MPCGRCGGLMVIETVHDVLEKGSRLGKNAARCVNCGNFEDFVIRTNRVTLRPPRRFGPRTGGQ